MRHLKAFTFSAAIATFAATLYAGGFHVTVGNPEANPQAKKMNAVLTARVVGCQNPSTAALTATAIGIVDGKRREVQLQPVALGDSGMYGLKREWPAEGRWVVQLVATYGAHQTSALVPFDASGANRAAAKHMAGAPSRQDVDAFLTGGTDNLARK